MARRGPRRGAAIGVPRRARFGARPPRPARSPVSAGWVAGDRDPGDRGGDGLLRRATRPGRLPRRSRCSPNSGMRIGDQPRRRSERYFDDWIRRIWTAASAPISPRWPRPRQPPRAGSGGRSGRQDAARGASGRSGRRAPGVGVRPPRPASARPARRRREEQRNPLCAKDSPPLPAGAAAGHGGRDAHPDRDREADLRTLKSHYLMIVKSNSPSCCPHHRLPWTGPSHATNTARPRPRERAPSKCSPPPRHRIPPTPNRSSRSPANRHPPGERTRELCAICSLLRTRRRR